MIRQFTAVSRVCLALATVVLGASAARAHPHVFVEARAEVQLDAAGRLVAVRNIWRFDDVFSAYARQGLEHLKTGRLTPKSLEALARVNIHSLDPYRYFTHVHLDGKRVPLGSGGGQQLADDGETLTWTFTVTPPAPIPLPEGGLTIDLYDPEYFVALSFVKDRPVSLVGGPAGCRAQIFTPTGLTPAAAAALARVPAAQRTLPADMQALTGGFENGVVVECPR